MKEITDDPLYVTLHNAAAAGARRHDIDWSRCGLAQLPSRGNPTRKSSKQRLRPLAETPGPFGPKAAL